MIRSAAADSVVVERQERRRVATGARSMPDQAEDVAVVAEDHVGVAGVAIDGRVDAGVMPSCCARCACRRRRRSCRCRRAAGRRCEAERLELPPIEVVLAEVAEDHVVAAVALDLVVGRRRRCRRSPRPTRASARTSMVMRPASSIVEPSPWMVSLPSWPKMTSSSAPPAMLSSPYVAGSRVAMVVQAHVALLHRVRVELRG